MKALMFNRYHLLLSVLFKWPSFHTYCRLGHVPQNRTETIMTTGAMWTKKCQAECKRYTNIRHKVVASFAFFFLQFDRDAAHGTFLNALHQMCYKPTSQQPTKVESTMIGSYCGYNISLLELPTWYLLHITTTITNALSAIFSVKFRLANSVCSKR